MKFLWTVFAIAGIWYFFVSLGSNSQTNNIGVILAPLFWSGFCIYKLIKLMNKTEEGKNSNSPGSKFIPPNSHNFFNNDKQSSTHNSEVIGDESIAEIFNKGVNLFKKNHFKEAIKFFNHCIKENEFKIQAVYAKFLCHNEIGSYFEVPDDLEIEEDKIEAVFITNNLACHLINTGYNAALKDQSCVLAIIDDSLYDIRVLSLMGSIMINAWRKEKDKTIPISDSGVNPTPSKSDKFVILLAKDAANLPLSPIPEGGIPESLT